ncbi:nucleotidyl transferase AbiEii/AbiGii toxin family protein [Patescibacteria group bacterium]|nr:nucleotidyl transferase AbiEii/AbiGii toxin family protein [Patescibacteria group bacterium]
MILPKIFLKNLISESKSKNKIFLRNSAKEYLQILVLDFIYSNPKYRELIFYGGSCLAHCFGLPRLSEDLDFVDLKKKIILPVLAKDLKAYFKNLDLKMVPTIQKFRLYLKFPLLRELGLSGEHETDLLFLKIEIFKEFAFKRGSKIEMVPLFKFNQSILVRSFDLPTLMSTKIRAILWRKFEKTDKEGKVFIKVKGRDYFDLMWYLDQGVTPNFKCLEIKDKTKLKEKLLEIVKKVDARSIKLDLEPLIDDQNFVLDLSKNIKEILIKKISQL